jgi:type IV pilus assembly protein PilM
VTAYATEPVPPGSIVDGSILDEGAVTAAIRRLFKKTRFRSRHVAAAVSGNAVIVKRISLPVMTESELAGWIHWEAGQYIPFDIRDVSLDYQVLEDGTGGGSTGAMEVLLVAAKKETIDRHRGVITAAGRVPAVMDVDAFALQNAFETNYGAEPGAVVVLLDVGASTTNVNIVSGEQSLFTRDISMGGNSYTDALQNELGLAFEAAEQAKRGEPLPHVTFDDVRAVMRAITGSVLLEIQKTFDFFKATAGSEGLDRLYLSGGASAMNGLADALGERFGVPIEQLDPFRRIAIDRKRLRIDDRDQPGLTSAVAVGLALRKAGDR